MIVNTLFSVFVAECVAWLGEKLGRVLCPRCGSTEPGVVNNITYNQFACHQCGNTYRQYINATDHTLNRDYSIISASISQVNTSIPERGRLRLYNLLDVINSIDEPVVLESRLGEPTRFPFYQHNTGLITPQRSLSTWKTSCIVPVHFFPLRECDVVVELNVFNTWGDKLDAHLGVINTIELFRRMISLEIDLLAVEQRMLMLEYRELEMRRQQNDYRFKQVVLQLTEHLLHG